MHTDEKGRRSPDKRFEAQALPDFEQDGVWTNDVKLKDCHEELASFAHGALTGSSAHKAAIDVNDRLLQMQWIMDDANRRRNEQK